MKQTILFIVLLGVGLALVSCGGAGDITRPASLLWIAPMDAEGTGEPVPLPVAAVCMAVDLDPAANRAKMVSFVDRITADHPGVRLILFGETSLGWYYRPATARAYQESVAEPIPGLTTGIMAAEAAAHGVYLSFGLVERAGDVLYNSQVLLDPAGGVASVHRKMRLTPWDIENGFQAGGGVTFATVDGVKVATVICYDSMGVEVSRQIHDGGARLVLLPLADMNDETFLHYDPLALTVGAWVVSANRVGGEDGNWYQGHVAIADPLGAVRKKSAGAEAYVYLEAGL